MSFSEDDRDDDWVLYRDRPEWADVKPIPQNDGPNPVVRIAYTDVFIDIYDYFRAVVASEELSERALKLTEDALHANAANYTVWQYRRQILKHLKCELESELVFCREMIEGNPKNYQVWHHRRVIVEWMSDPSRELRLTEIILNNDAKNYHAWEHRQWVLRTFKLYEGELEFVDYLLDADVRNNSAWNQRYFVISQTTGFTAETIEREVDYCKAAIKKLVNNESSWSYLRGVLENSGSGMASYGDLEAWCQGLYDDAERSPYLLSFQIDILEDRMSRNESLRNTLLPQAVQICEALASQYDKIRQEYWRYFARHLTTKFS